MILHAGSTYAERYTRSGLFVHRKSMTEAHLRAALVPVQCAGHLRWFMLLTHLIHAVYNDPRTEGRELECLRVLPSFGYSNTSFLLLPPLRWPLLPDSIP
jgi:hypothetical protein